MKEIDPEVVTPEYELYEDDMEGNHQSIPDVDDVTPEELDNYVGAEVNLPFGGMMRADRVKSHARNAAGELVGTQNSNPILDTCVYTVEFPEGERAEVSANVIAEHMFLSVTPMEDSFNCFSQLWITSQMDMLLNQQTDSLLLEVDSILVRPLQDGNCVLNGRMVPHLGSA